jgi:hypothetical protein
MTATVDATNLASGLHEIQWAGRPLEMRMLAPELPPARDLRPAPMETYIRGNDFVASFEQPGPLPAVPQLYWRVRPSGSTAAIGIELIVSMRTDLLDSQPQMCVVTEVGNATSGNLPLRHLRLSADVSYYQLVHPDDFFAVEERRVDGTHRITTTLFPERMEKGVIRRARICGWFLPAENDLAVAVELAQQFVAESPPLTT